MREVFKENQTYVLENFLVFKNEDKFKVSDHPFKVVINEGTVIRVKDLPEIPTTGYKFKEFEDTLKGNFDPNLLVGMVSFVEFNYSK